MLLRYSYTLNATTVLQGHCSEGGGLLLQGLYSSLPLALPEIRTRWVWFQGPAAGTPGNRCENLQPSTTDHRKHAAGTPGNKSRGHPEIPCRAPKTPHGLKEKRIQKGKLRKFAQGRQKIYIFRTLLEDSPGSLRHRWELGSMSLCILQGIIAQGWKLIKKAEARVRNNHIKKRFNSRYLITEVVRSLNRYEQEIPLSVNS